MRLANRLLLLVCAASLAACQQGGGEDGNQAAGNATAGSASASGGQSATGTGTKTILESAAQSADHSTLVAALKAAGLSETLGGAGPYTVLAPTNAAFQKLPAGAADELMKPESKGRLTGLLTHHILPGVVTAKDLGAAIERGGGKAQIATLGGGRVTASQADGGIVIADGKGGTARVTQADMIQSNGVVHSIDGVLTPE